MLPAIALSSLLLVGSLPAPAANATPVQPSGFLLVVGVVGDVQSGDRTLRAGASIAIGDEVRAAQGAHARLKLADGSIVSFFGPGSLLLESVRGAAPEKGGETALQLNQGRIEADIRQPKRAEARLAIRTPFASATTRGALFRVTAQAQSTTCEVAEGSVQVADSRGLGSVPVPGGSGTRIVAGQAPMKPVPLLPAPHLWNGIQLVERKRAEVPFSPLDGAFSYRLIVSPGDDLHRHIVDEIVRAPRLHFVNLADGDYFVRVRAIDSFGLEGAGATVRMKVQFRPDPPSLTLPRDQARLHGKSAELAWLREPDAVGYVAQLAPDAGFRSPEREWTGLSDTKVTAAELRPGWYHWRVSSVFKDGTRSRASTTRTFRLFAPPVPPSPPKIEGDVLHFTWPAERGQVFLLQVAADPGFQLIVEERRSDRPGVEVPRPLPGSYFARLRTTEPDGTVAPFSDTTRFEVARNAKDAKCLAEGERGVCAVYAPAAPEPR